MEQANDEDQVTVLVTDLTRALRTSGAFGCEESSKRLALDSGLADLVAELAVQLRARDVTGADDLAAAAEQLRQSTERLRGVLDDPNAACTCSHSARDHTYFGCARDIHGGNRTCSCGHQTGFTFAQDRQRLERELQAPTQ